MLGDSRFHSAHDQPRFERGRRHTGHRTLFPEDHEPYLQSMARPLAIRDEAASRFCEVKRELVQDTVGVISVANGVNDDLIPRSESENSFQFVGHAGGDVGIADTNTHPIGTIKRSASDGLQILYHTLDQRGGSVNVSGLRPSRSGYAGSLQYAESVPSSVEVSVRSRSDHPFVCLLSLSDCSPKRKRDLAAL